MLELITSYGAIDRTMSKIYGYCRCSLAEERGQDLNRQARELRAAGAEGIITEREHGDAAKKPNLDFLLDHMEEQSTLMVLEVSRLSRSVLQFCEIINKVKEKHLRLVILGSITVDCRNGEMDPMSAAFLQMASIFSELELSMLRARVKSGLDNARAKGRHIGRKPTTKDDIPAVFYKHYPAFSNGSMNLTEFARICSLSRQTVYKYLKLIE